MNAFTRLSRSSWSSLALAGVASLAVACGGSNPPAQSPSNDTAKAPPPPPPAPPSQSSTASDVDISREILTKCGIPDADAYFSFDSAHVTSKDRSPLDKVATCFKTGPLKGHAVKLVGHADPRGSSDYNMTLGESRADAVASYLGARGLAKDKTQPTSRGAEDAQGTDESGWARDRRVDVMLGD